MALSGPSRGTLKSFRALSNSSLERDFELSSSMILKFRAMPKIPLAPLFATVDLIASRTCSLFESEIGLSVGT